MCHMAVVAFVDMVGTHASAIISNEEYAEGINFFTDSLTQLSEICNCKIYGYSDNAYIEFPDPTQMALFFQLLRENLMNQHRYFTAAVSFGSLKANYIPFVKHKGFAIKFTSPVAADIYVSQCRFSGIGISLSDSIVKKLHSSAMDALFCTSIYHRCDNSGDDLGFEGVVDLAYKPVTLEQLRYIFADYIMASAMSFRAGRYYLTPIISMIKCLDPSVILNDLQALVELLSLQATPPAFRSLKYIDTYSQHFIFALIDSVISMRETDPTIDAIKACEYIISYYKNQEFKFIHTLSGVHEYVISPGHKREFLRILYNIKNESVSMENSINEARKTKNI